MKQKKLFSLTILLIIFPLFFTSGVIAQYSYSYPSPAPSSAQSSYPTPTSYPSYYSTTSSYYPANYSPTSSPTLAPTTPLTSNYSIPTTTSTTSNATVNSPQVTTSISSSPSTSTLTTTNPILSTSVTGLNLNQVQVGSSPFKPLSLNESYCMLPFDSSHYDKDNNVYKGDPNNVSTWGHVMRFCVRMDAPAGEPEITMDETPCTTVCYSTNSHPIPSRIWWVKSTTNQVALSSVGLPAAQLCSTMMLSFANLLWISQQPNPWATELMNEFQSITYAQGPNTAQLTLGCYALVTMGKQAGCITAGALGAIYNANKVNCGGNSICLAAWTNAAAAMAQAEIILCQ